MAQHDTIIIGGGLSGLIAARKLAEAGRDVLVLEKESTVGGRQRTREIDGFFLDRGFQLLNPAYPNVKKYVDIDALDFHPFGSGVQVRTEEGLDLLAHPARHPQHLKSTLSSRLVNKSELKAFVSWFGKGTLATASPGRRSSLSVGQAWDKAGITGPLRKQVLEPFLAGVVATDDLSTSSDYVRFLFRMFALGQPGVPSRGIQAVPNQLVAKARRAGAEIRTFAPVESYTEHSDHVSVSVKGQTVTAKKLIFAAGPETVAWLTGSDNVPTHGLSTWWFRADDAPTDKRFIAVDGTRSGPILNTAVMTNVAPSYSPDGTALIQASALLDQRSVSDGEAKAHTAKIWGIDSSDLDLIARDDIRHSLPDHPAGASTKRKAQLSDRTFLAGDHQATPSIDGALAAGVRAAKEALKSKK